MIFLISCIRPAPSTRAASYISWSMPAMAARYMMEPQPSPFHVFHRSMDSHTCSPLSRIFRGSEISPRFWHTVLNIPVAENRQKAME